MKIVFFGSSEFAVPSLKAILASDHNVAAVVTQPDKQKGRHLHSAGTAIKGVALESGVKICQPANVNDKEAHDFLKGLKADLFIVIAYGQILSRQTLNIPGIFSVNLHASLLPVYRGAAPINWAIIKGENITGITAMKMVEEMDAGPVIMQKEIAIDSDDNADTLEKKLSGMAAGMILPVIACAGMKNCGLAPQDAAKITFAYKLKKEDGLIHWDRPAQDILNLVRGCIRWPGAFTYYKGKLLKVYKAALSGALSCQIRKSPGEIMEVSKNSITVATGKGGLIIEELQIEGKRRMRAGEFIAGHKISVGQVFDGKD
jgi:methionyl-tRNA formyltransferase